MGCRGGGGIPSGLWREGFSGQRDGKRLGMGCGCWVFGFFVAGSLGAGSMGDAMALKCWVQPGRLPVSPRSWVKRRGGEPRTLNLARMCETASRPG